MASIGFLIGGALINALAFSGSNFLFSSLSKESIDKERKRHDKTIEDLQRAQKNDWITLITKQLKSTRLKKVYRSKFSYATVFPSDW